MSDLEVINIRLTGEPRPPSADDDIDLPCSEAACRHIGIIVCGDGRLRCLSCWMDWVRTRPERVVK